MTNTYDTLSRVSPLLTTYGYDPLFNKPTQIVDPLGLVTSMSYDGTTGNLLSIVADAGTTPHFNARTNFSYDNRGLAQTATDPLGSITQYRYDSFGNQTSIIRDFGAGRLNQLALFSYSPQGDVISARDPNGNVATRSYDARRQLLTSTSPATSASPGGIVTAQSYDPDGRVVAQTQRTATGSVLRSTSATYTLTGKTATATDANNNTTSFAYDVLDRLSSIKDPTQRVTSFAYDTLSRRTQVLNTAIQSTPLLQQAYTPDGLLASLTDANNHATSFAYDGFDRLATTTYPLGSTEVLTYDSDSNVLTRKTRAGATINFGYDTLNRLKTKTPPSPAAVVSYGYDLAGRLTGVSDTSAAIAAAVPPSGPSVQYATTAAYDALNRPTGISWNPAPTTAVPTASGVTFNHAYNKANQRIGQTATDNSWFNYPAATPSTVSYTADALNRYTAVGAVAPTYDGNSNLTFDGTFTFGYDAENRLTSASGAGNTAAYTYGAQGRRKTKTVNGTTTVFVTDGGNREVLEYDGASGAILRWYAYGLGSNDALNQMNVAAATRATFIPDIQGSIIASLDSSAGTLSKVGYLPYGKSASAGPFGYTGQRIDPESSGLYYYRARQYSPAWGRFMQPDPIGYQGGINLYAYVGNDPLNLIDPFGFGPSYGQSLLRGTVNAVPGAYYAGLAQQQFEQGNYGAAAIYETFAFADAALAMSTLGLSLSTRVGSAVRAVESGLTATERVSQLAESGLTQIQRERFVTLAVTDTAEGTRVISSSSKTLEQSVINLLQEGEVGVSGVGHAEVTGVEGARSLGLTQTGLAASRSICGPCANYLSDQGVTPLTPLR